MRSPGPPILGQKQSSTQRLLLLFLLLLLLLLLGQNPSTTQHGQSTQLLRAFDQHSIRFGIHGAKMFSISGGRAVFAIPRGMREERSVVGIHAEEREVVVEEEEEKRREV